MKLWRLWPGAAVFTGLMIAGVLIDADALQTPTPQPTPAAAFFRVGGKVTETGQGSFVLEVTP